MPQNRIGISGWTFDGWRGTFYPEDLPQKKELEFASRKLNSIEINGTFYSLQRPHSFKAWYDQTPKDFQFAVKAPQFITHVLRLRDAEEPLNNFLASGVLALKEKLGPILWQFPPFVTLKDDRFEQFMKRLPQDAKAALKLAKKHGERMKDRNFLEVKSNFPLRHAFEFRHKSFLNKDFLEFMRAHNIAFVASHESGEKVPYSEEPTADFFYARLHGKKYAPKAIGDWNKKIQKFNKQGLDCYIYISTEDKVLSPPIAEKLLKLAA